MAFISLWWPVALVVGIGLGSFLGINALLVTRWDELGWRRVLRLSAGLSLAIGLGTLWLGAGLAAMSFGAGDVVVMERDSFETLPPAEIAPVEAPPAPAPAPEIRVVETVRGVRLSGPIEGERLLFTDPYDVGTYEIRFDQGSPRELALVGALAHGVHYTLTFRTHANCRESVDYCGDLVRLAPSDGGH